MSMDNTDNKQAQREWVAKEKHVAAQSKGPVAQDGSEHQDDDVGDIRVADEVIRIVAGLAAQEVPGVLRMSGGLAESFSSMLGKDNASKGVRIKFSGNLVEASIFVDMEYGWCIPEVALSVQEKVKEAIESMTGYMVQSVDVHVEGVGRAKDNDLEKIGSAGTIGAEEARMEGVFAAEEADLDEEEARRRAMFFEEE